MAAANELEDKGIMVHGIRSPTVKAGTERLRVSLKSNISISELKSGGLAILDVLNRYS